VTIRIKNVPLFRGNIPKTKSHIFNSKGCQELCASSYQLQVISPRLCGSEMLFATLEFDQDLCTCSPDIMGPLQNISADIVKREMSHWLKSSAVGDW